MGEGGIKEEGVKDEEAAEKDEDVGDGDGEEIEVEVVLVVGEEGGG